MTTTFDDVKNVSTEEYFNGNQFSIDVFNKKYAQNIDGKLETYSQAVKRVCDYIASCEETEELRNYWSERWFDEIYNDWWHPAGSIMQGAASGKSVSLSNCSTVSLGSNEDTNWDNLESIIKNTAYTVAKMAAYRQGLGVDFSKLRPRGCEVRNSSNESQGVIHWMKFMDSLGNYIGQKGRIPAMLFSLSVNHPDIEEFIKVKSDFTIIQNANISVHTNDAFYKAVEDDSDWELSYTIPATKKGDRVYVDVHSTTMDCKQDEDGRYYRLASKDRPEETMKKTIKARYLLELISKQMLLNAEPGIQQMDLAKYWSNSDYLVDPTGEYSPLICSTNACSEQYLSRDSVCVLSSINAGKFSTEEEDFTKELKKIAYSVNRFLDNVNSMELINQTYATPHQRMAIEKLRRTGAGITNIAAWFFKKNLEYGSVEANESMLDFNRIYNFYLYESSISLGKEKGSFGIFNKENFEKAPFVQEMMKQGLVFDSMRNCTCSSIAPTGSLALMFRDYIMSTGVEPAMGMYYWKRTRISGYYEYYFCVPRVVREVFEKAGYTIPISSDTIKDTWDGSLGVPIAKFIDENSEKIGIKFKKASDVKALDKLDLMSKLMKYVDSSISVTYALPEDTQWQEVYNLILEANKKGVKSLAAFTDRKMYGIISYVPFKQLAVELKSQGVQIFSANFTEEEAKELNISTSEKSKSSNAPSRHKELLCDVYQVKVRGKQYIMVVGLQDNSPYEMFGGLVPENINFKFKTKKGLMIKEGQSKYKLIIDDSFEINNFGEYFTASEQMLFRMVSIALRHGIPIKFVVDQLHKAAEDVSDLAAATSRVLKKYIKDGETAGGECPVCGRKELIYIDGCVSCTCGWSKGCG